MMNENVTVDALKGKLGDSVFLNAEEYTSLRAAVIETPQEDNVMINAFPLVQEDQWQKFHQYTKLDQYGNATESDAPGDAEAVEVNGTKVSTQLPFYHADFHIDSFDLQNSRRLGGRLDTIKARTAARIVNNLFDEAIYKRSSLFGTMGARNLFTGSVSASGVWTGTTPDVIFNDVNSWITASIPAAYQTPNLRLVLHQTNYGHLTRANTYGLNALKLIRETHPGLQIVVSKQVSVGEGLLYPFRDDVAYVVQAWPLSTIEWEVKPLEARYKVMRSGRLIVIAATAGLKLNGLGTT
jgi:hypothetical protein